MSALQILLVEDDIENLKLLRQTLPTTIGGHTLLWHECTSFDIACEQLRDQHFDLVVTDVYRDRKEAKKSSIENWLICSPLLFDELTEM